MDMTLITGEAYKKAIDDMVTIEDAKRYLENELRTRSLYSKIMKFAGGRDVAEVRKILVNGLLEDHPEKKKESVDKRVRGWLNPESSHSLHKKDAIEVAFLLGLSFEEADKFVTMVSGERLHLRNADEIIYIYGLQNGLSYLETCALASGMGDVLKAAKDKVQEKLDIGDFTENLRPQILSLHREEDLRAFLVEQIDRIGHYHNQAYVLFNEMLEQLQEPLSKYNAEELWNSKKEKLTIRDILQEYMYQNSVLAAREKAVASKKLVKKGKISKDSQFILSRIQKDICDEWPDETTISKMKARSMDVTRKVLILLFLASDAGIDGQLAMDDPEIKGKADSYAYGANNDIFKKESDSSEQLNGDDRNADDKEYWYDDPTREEAFEDIRYRLDYMLTLCGYSELDPRSPFDWLILYCICAEDLLEVDERMKGMFLEMFQDSHHEQEHDPTTDPQE